MRQTIKSCTIFFIVALLASCADTSQQLAGTQHRPDKTIVSQAKKLIGTPYTYGGKKPSSGLDCSGLVSHVYARAGVPLEGTAADMASRGKKISQSDLAAGDLVFFNTMGQRMSHVGIYIGDGRFIHAPGKGDSVRVSDLSNPYFKKRFTGARSYFSSNDTPALLASIAQTGFSLQDEHVSP